jgi:Ser/Thr protein kinase RdoA (MazF antagonist)
MMPFTEETENTGRKSAFDVLTPELIFRSVEKATGKILSGLIYPLPSYINRVYELQDKDKGRLIAKFYRPGRWTQAALQEEHDFVVDCAADEIPVVAPTRLLNGRTLDAVEGVYFAVYPKRLGRQFEITCDEDWARLGRLAARIHVAGARRKAEHRVRLDPQVSTAEDIRLLTCGDLMTPQMKALFRDIGNGILDEITDLFIHSEFIRLHGDCHRGNLLEHPDEGLRIIDFDDMMVGPPIQDIWLLLPSRAQDCRREIDLILKGYEQFRAFDATSLRLIEPLRAMRMIYFLAWCGWQKDDYRFRETFPDWGKPGFWQREIADLTRQLQVIQAEKRLRKAVLSFSRRQ